MKPPPPKRNTAPRPVVTRRKDVPDTRSLLGRLRLRIAEFMALLERDPRPVSNPLEALLGPPPRRGEAQGSNLGGDLIAPDTPLVSSSRRPAELPVVPPAAAASAPDSAAPPPLPEPAQRIDPRDERIEALLRELAAARSDLAAERASRAAELATLEGERSLAGNHRLSWARREAQLIAAGEAQIGEREARIRALDRELFEARAVLETERAAARRRDTQSIEEIEELRRERDRFRLIADAASRKTAEALRELETLRLTGPVASEARAGRLPDA